MLEMNLQFFGGRGSGGGKNKGGGGGASGSNIQDSVKKTVENGSYSAYTVSKELGISEKEALQRIKVAQKEIGIERGTTLGMESGETRKLNRSNMSETEYSRALNTAAAVSQKKTTYGQTCQKTPTGNWASSKAITNVDTLTSAYRIKEFKYKKK